MSVHAISWVLRHSEAHLGDRLVLLVLADHAHGDGSNAYPSVATIGHEAHLSERQAQRALRRLEAMGEIVATGTRPSGVNVYALTLQTTLGGDNMSGRQIGSGVTNRPVGGDVGVTRTKREEEQGISSTTCPECGLGFKSQLGKDRHVRNVHEGVAA